MLHRDYQYPILPLVNGTLYLFIHRNRGASTRSTFYQIEYYWREAHQYGNFRWVKANPVGIYVAFQDSIDGARDAWNVQASLYIYSKRHRRWDPVTFPDSVQLLGEVDAGDARRALADCFFA